jgi:hypothetical protein
MLAQCFLQKKKSFRKQGTNPHKRLAVGNQSALISPDPSHLGISFLRAFFSLFDLASVGWQISYALLYNSSSLASRFHFQICKTLPIAVIITIPHSLCSCH